MANLPNTHARYNVAVSMSGFFPLVEQCWLVDKGLIVIYSQPHSTAFYEPTHLVNLPSRSFVNASRQISPWRAWEKVPHSYLPREWQRWVLDRGSLTKRLQQASAGDFKVRLVSLGWCLPAVDEALVLGMPLRRHALIREVELICRGEVRVRARSVIPARTLSGEERQLKHLGQKPLGEFLFRSKSMRRRPLQLACFHDASNGIFYGRRSVFLLHGKPLLVSEYFMPSLRKLNRRPVL